MFRFRRTTTGSTFFFTLIAWRRRPILGDDIIRDALRNAILTVRARRPFAIDAWVQLPDHLHCIWTLPRGDIGHGLVGHASLWPYSSFGRYVRDRIYPPDWCGPVEMQELLLG